MKTTIIALVCIAVLAVALPAQSLANNEYYQRSVELKTMAEAAFDEGDYDAAVQYSIQSREYAELSDRYVSMMLARRDAERSIKAAETRLAWAIDVGGESWYPAELAEAKALMQEADNAFLAEGYGMAKARADEVLVALAKVEDPRPRMAAMKSEAAAAIAAAEERFSWAEGIAAEKRYPVEYAAAAALLQTARTAFATEDYDYARISANEVLVRLAGLRDTTPLPAIFVVRELPKDTDCFWRIAALPAIYNDPFQWPVLYEANKNKLPDPKNPNLVKPDTVLTIPSLKGEYREGTWTQDAKYPVFGE
jgi:nucleoid-associated protein YgaU